MRGLVLVGLVVALAAGCDDGSSPADAAPLTADAGVQGATGFVTLTSGTYDFGGEEESAMWSMAAGFSRAGESERSCVTEVRGDCRLSDCVAVGLPDAGAVDGGPVGPKTGCNT